MDQESYLGVGCLVKGRMSRSIVPAVTYSIAGGPLPHG
jgi:hypothetical protein